MITVIKRKITVIFLSIILFSVLHAQGNYVFGPNVKVNDDPGGQAFHTVFSSGGHTIAARSDTVYIAYRGDQSDTSNVYFTKSTDGGQTWSPGLRVNYPYHGIIQSLAVDARGDIFIAYTHVDGNSRDDVHFTKSTNGGLSFSYPITVNDDGTTHSQWFPSIAVDTSGQKVFIAWEDARNYDTSQWDIYFARSTDGGLTFSPNIRIDDTGSDTSWQCAPGIAVDRAGENVYITWYDERNWNNKGADIYFSRSTDGGLSFLPNVLVNDTATTGSTHQWDPTIAVDTLGRIFIAWVDEREPVRGIYFSRSDDGGLTFGPDIRVTDDGYNIPGYRPSIAVDDLDGVYVVWGDDYRLSLGGDRIYFAYSDCAGDSFLPNVRVDDLPVNVQYSLHDPTLAINKDKKVFIAWTDDRHNHLIAWDIYFACGTYVGIAETKGEPGRQGEILKVYPNPFKNALMIRLHIPDNGLISSQYSVASIKIYDASGCLVKSFNHLSANPPSIVAFSGGNRIVWDGRDDYGQNVACGVYFVEVRAEERTFVKKVVKVR